MILFQSRAQETHDSLRLPRMYLGEGMSMMGSVVALLFRSGLIVSEVLTELGMLMSFRGDGS